MNLIQARKIANDIEVNQLDAGKWAENREKVCAAFHKLDMSDPTTIDLRREDMRLARVIWREVGFV